MKTIYKITVLLLLIPLLTFANKPIKKHEKSKTIKKEYAVNADATLLIDTKYGNIDVITWNENRIEITVKITVKGDNESKVEDKLSSIKIEFNASKSLVEATTIIESQKSKWTWWGSNNNMSYQINYFVKMPESNNIDFNNKYGNIILDQLEGTSNINCKYGNLDLGELNNKNNTISLDYGNADIHFIKTGNIDVDYSKFRIKNAGILKVNCDYTNLDVGVVKDINFNADYGSVTIDKADNIDGNSDYASMKIGTVTKNATLDTDYGGIRIDNIEKGFNSVVIDGDYAGIKVGTNSSNNFDFTVDLGYASFKYPSNTVDMRKSIKKTTKKYYEGSFGTKKSTSTLKIKSSYGGVSIYHNN